MDDYSKSGPKSYQAEARAKQIEKIKELRRLLAEPTEAAFIQALEMSLKITRSDPEFAPAVSAWREQHR